ELQIEKDIGVIFISHDLGLVAEIADRAIVMFKGKIVEQNTIHDLFTNPRHPYTKALLACRPTLHAKGERLPVVSDFMDINEDGTVVKKEKQHDNNERIERVSMQAKPDVPGDASPLVKVENLKVWFPAQRRMRGTRKRYIKA